MEEALDVGRYSGSLGLVIGAVYLDVAETAVVGDKITARIGIGMLHLQLEENVIVVHPSEGTLGIEQDALASAHDGHLGKVVGIIVTIHRLAERGAAVTEHVNL